MASMEAIFVARFADQIQLIEKFIFFANALISLRVNVLARVARDGFFQVQPEALLVG